MIMKRILLLIAAMAAWCCSAQTLKTPWAEKVDKAMPHPEYPRPIMQRSQ